MTMNGNSSCSHTHQALTVTPLVTLLAILMVARLGFAASPDRSISPSVAGLFIGEEAIVEGPVTGAEREANVVHLRLGKAPQDMIVSLVIGLLNSFPPAPETYYPGKTVRVAGTIRSFRGVPEIVIRDAPDIQVVGNSVGAPPAAVAPAAASAMAVAPAREDDSLLQRVEVLTERVRQLEERVRQLENPGTHP